MLQLTLDFELRFHTCMLLVNRHTSKTIDSLVYKQNIKLTCYCGTKLKMKENINRVINLNVYVNKEIQQILSLDPNCQNKTKTTPNHPKIQMKKLLQ